jgi:hypothetical protein
MSEHRILLCDMASQDRRTDYANITKRAPGFERTVSRKSRSKPAGSTPLKSMYAAPSIVVDHRERIEAEMSA